MNGRLLGCAIGAVAVHGALLFGLHLDSDAAALAMSDAPNSVEVSLVAEAPPPEQVLPPDPEPPPEPPPNPTPPPEQPPPPAPPTDEMTEPSTTPVEPPPAPPQHPRVTKPDRSPHPPPRTGAPAVAGPRTVGPQSASASPGVTARAQYRNNPKPDYPAEAKRLRQEGVVMLSVGVNAEGRVTDVSIARSSGYSLLDQAAGDAVRRWTFTPATTLGLPVASRPSVPVRFRLPAQ